jgi:hypothetical protein
MPSKILYRVRAGAACDTIGKALFDYTSRGHARSSLNPALGLGQYDLRIVREECGGGEAEIFVEVWTKP